MNISVTNRCSRRCEYCFQREWFLEGDGRGIVEMPVSMFTQILELMDNGDFNIMGGEPLLYSHLYEVLDICEKKDRRVCFFSNLIAPHPFLRKVANEYGCVRGWLVNTDFTESQEGLFYKNLDYIVNYSDAGVSLATTLVPDSEMNQVKADRIAKVIDHYASEEHLHIRVAPATPTHNNVFDFYDYTDDMLSFCETVFKVKPDIEIGFDCTINACELHPEFIRQMRNKIEFSTTHCNNPPLDFMPDGSVIWCSSSYSLIKIPDFRIYKKGEDIHEELHRQWDAYWDTHEMACDYKNCKKFGPSTCFALCIAKNYVKEKMLERQAAQSK